MAIERLVAAQVKLIQREGRLEYQLYDGRRTALLLLEDVRPGDVVEYSYTIAGTNPALGRSFGRKFALAWTAPVGAIRVRVLWPSARPLTIRTFHTSIEPEVSEQAGVREYRWAADRVSAVDFEDDTPLEDLPIPLVQVTSFTTWAEVAEWGAGMFNAAAEPDGPVARKVREIQSASRNQEEGALTAVRFVQEDVRYLGVETGERSHRPTPPDVVLRRRFGDCKDKVALLVALLRGVGVRADPALVHSTNGAILEDMAPSPLLFDHSIALVRLGGRAYWLDPTMMGQRGAALACLHIPAYRAALVIAPGTTGLSRVDPTPESTPRVSIDKRLEATEFDGPATLTARTTYRGGAAEEIRAQLRANGQATVAEGWLRFYEQTYPEIQAIGPPQIADDVDSNVVRVTERYLAQNFWKQGKDAWMTANIHAVELAANIGVPRKAKRTAPLEVSLPAHVEYACSIHLPVMWTLPPESTTITNSAMRFRSRSSGRGDWFRMTCSLDRYGETVPASSASRYIADMENVLEALQVPIQIGKPLRAWPLQPTNWPMLVLLMGTLAGSVVVARTIYRLRPPVPGPAMAVGLDSEASPLEPVPRPLAYASTTTESAGAGAADVSALVPAEAPVVHAPLVFDRSWTEPDIAPKAPPIGGWLLVLGLTVFVTPLMIAASSGPALRVLGASSWRQMTSFAHHSLMAPLLVFELVWTATSLTGFALGAVMFVQRHRLFPRTWVCLMALQVLAMIVDFAAISSIPALSLASHTMARETRMIGRAIILLAIWGTYLIRSKRARETFVA